jgi:protein-L-isoaspartate O-methyltransferase
VNWQSRAARLARQVTHPASPWASVVATLPRHLFVPHWWARAADEDRWALRDGPADEYAWLDAAYADRSLVTQVGPLHADQAAVSDRPAGMPTSSATLPGLIVQMAGHGYLREGLDVLDVGTGSGYGCAVLATHVGDRHVTSIDVDAYLTTAAAGRLDDAGLHPRLETLDATGPLPATYDRIIATVAVRPIPPSWLAALRPGGRLVTTIADTALILTADKTGDGHAVGRIEWDRAGFMAARSGPDYPPRLTELYESVRDADGDDISEGRYPVVDVLQAWELWSLLSVTVPGVEHRYRVNGEFRTAWMLHADGSWARATGPADDPPEVHQGGPQRLWDILDDLRHQWLADGQLPVYGATAGIDPEGRIHLRRGAWTADITR